MKGQSAENVSCDRSDSISGGLGGTSNMDYIRGGGRIVMRLDSRVKEQM
jgi:hypothetical protein